MLKIVILGILFIATCSPQGSRTTPVAELPAAILPTPEEVNENLIPDTPVRPSVFADAIEDRTRHAGIQRLRDGYLANDDIEVRVWMGFGKTKLRGFILKRTDKKWSGYS